MISEVRRLCLCGDRVVAGCWAVAFCGLVFAVVQTVFTWVSPPTVLVDQAIGVWSSLCIVSAAFTSGCDRASAVSSREPRSRLLQLLNVIEALILASTAISFFIYGRLDVGMMTTVATGLMTVNWFNCNSTKPTDPGTLQSEGELADAQDSSPCSASKVSLLAHEVLPEHEASLPGSLPRTRSCCSCVCFWACHVLLMAVSLAFAHGASVFASGPILYPPRGAFMQLSLPVEGGGTQELSLLYEVWGPALSAKPVVLLEADASHGKADFWPLQRDLAALGIRSVSYDKPGLGYSGSYMAWQAVDPMSFYDQMLEKLRQESVVGPSVVFAGWGGGGQLVYEYALKEALRSNGSRSVSVAGLVFIDTFSMGIEWQSVAAEKGWDQSQMDAFKLADLASRVVTFAAIRGLLVPVGAMGMVLSNQGGYAWPERFDEYRWNYLIPRTWAVQWFSLLPEFSTSTPLQGHGIFDTPLRGKGIVSAMQIMENRTASAICAGTTTSIACSEALQSAAILQADATFIGEVTGHPEPRYCTDDDCGLDMPLRKPSFVASAIASASFLL